MSGKASRPIQLTQTTVYRDDGGGFWFPFWSGPVTGPHPPCAVCGKILRNGFVDYGRDEGLPQRYVCSKHVEITIPGRLSETIRPR